MGEPNEIKPGKGEFHEHPMDCICARTNRRTGHSKPYLSNRVGEAAGNHTSDAEFDWSDLDYGENTPLGGDSSNETDRSSKPTGRHGTADSRGHETARR